MKIVNILKAILVCMSLFTTPLMAENSDISQWKHVLYIEPLTVQKGTTSCTLSVKMKNENESQGFSFNLYLPSTFSFATLSNGDPDIQLSTERTDNTHIDEFKAAFQADGSVGVTAWALDGDGLITGNDGEVALAHIQIPADCPVGDYEIIIRNPVVTLNGVMAPWETDEVVTTLTVTAGKVLDENSVEMPEAATDVNVTVLRTIKANEWSTLCLPFAMTEAQVKAAFGNDVELADFNGIETTTEGDDVTGINVKFNTVTAIEANHPYVIKISNAITYENGFTVDGVNIEPTDELSIDKDETKIRIGNKWYYFYNSFVGTYVANTVIPEFCLFLSGNKFWYSKGNTKMKAFRAYFNFLDVLSDVANASARIGFTVEDETTGIKQIDSSKKNAEGVYDLQGRKVVQPAKGLYISNGKKIVKK